MNTSAECQSSTAADQLKQIFTIQVGNEWFGIPIDNVRTIFRTRKITPVPLAPVAVAGLVNVRGEVLTAIYAASCLDVANFKCGDELLIIGIEHHSESFGLIVSQAGDILDVQDEETILLPNNKQASGKSSNNNAASPHRASLPTYKKNGQYYPVIDMDAFFNALNSDSQAA